MRKMITLGIMLLFLGMTISSSTGLYVEKQSIKPMSFGNVLYVGGNGSGNYTKIQAAIDNTSDGDTVFVYSYSSPYFENIVVDKSINLLGENRVTTIIDGGSGWKDVVRITADGVTINGFLIQNSGSGWTNAGIKVDSHYNNISNNIILNNHDGVFLDSFNSTTIFCNTITDNEYGINFDFLSSNITIVGNIICYNSEEGIYLYDSNCNNRISNNLIHNNNGGILIEYYSHNNTISNNTISDTPEGLFISLSHNNTFSDNVFFNSGVYVFKAYQNNFYRNMVNGKPLVYLEGDSDELIDYQIGQIILIRCKNITIHNQELCDTTTGINLWHTNDCLISENILSNNHMYGIYFYNSSNNTISSNDINSNNYDGIRLRFSSNDNTISNNSVTANDDGIFLRECINNDINGNSISENHDNGISIHSSYKNNVSLNTLIDNNNSGIQLRYSSNSSVYGNTIVHNRYSGISIVNSFHIIIENNTISEIFYDEWNGDGIVLIAAVDITVSDNYIWNNVNGIEIIESSYNHVSNNIIANNSRTGINFWAFSSPNNTIVSNLITKNKYGIYLRTGNNEITFNNFIGNKVQASFVGCRNTWKGNYWNRFRILPKPIFGKLGRHGPAYSIPWVNFDWHPASEPYDIGV